MSPQDRLELLMFQIDALEAELRKAEAYEARLGSFRSDEAIRKDCLEENISFLRKRGIIASIEEFRIIQRNLIKTIEIIKTYDQDINRLKASVEVQKEKLKRAEKDRQDIMDELEGRKTNVIPFKRK